MPDKEQAIKIAEEYVTRVAIDHPDYRMGFELSGSINGEWLFSYLIKCLKNIPPEEQEQFLGAGGFIVTSTGQVQELNVPMYMELEQKVTK